MHSRLCFRALAACAATLYAVAPAAAAIPVIFTVDSANTSTTLQASADFFGTGIPQAPGSDTTTTVGHFLVEIDDPTNPTTFQFQAGDGFLQYINTANGANFSPGDTPANFALQTADGQEQVAARNLSWDFSSPVIHAQLGQSFSATNLTVDSLTGSYNSATFGNYDASDYQLPLSTGTAQISATAPGQLGLNITGTLHTSATLVFIQANFDFSGTFNATAAFDAANVAQTTNPAAPVASVLGGATQIGGVDAQFAAGSSLGTFSAQQIPLAGLPLDSLSGLPALGLTSLSQDAQVWNVAYSGAINGSVQLTFDYDPSRLTPAEQADPSRLSIAHFREDTKQWEILHGTVDPVNHTITVTTTSLSPFLLTSSVPEPSAFALALLGVTAGTFFRRRFVNRRRC